MRNEKLHTNGCYENKNGSSPDSSRSKYNNYISLKLDINPFGMDFILVYSTSIMV